MELKRKLKSIFYYFFFEVVKLILDLKDEDDIKFKEVKIYFYIYWRLF